jgi:hypothetical protein
MADIIINADISGAIGNLNEVNESLKDINSSYTNLKTTSDRALTGQVGLIEDIESAMKEWEEQKKKATKTEDIEKLNKKIAEGRQHLEEYNKKGVPALKEVDKQANSMSKTFMKLGGIIAAAFSVKKIIDFSKASVQAYNRQIKAEKALEVSLGRVSKAILAQASALQKKTVFGDEDIIQGQALLAQLGATEEQIMKLTPAILDLAQAKDMDLRTAFDMVSKSVGSSTNSMSRYGVEIEGVAGSNQRVESAVNSLTKAFGGQAEAAAKIGTGQLKQLQNQMGDLREAFGERIVRNMGGVTEALSKFVGKVDEYVRINPSQKMEEERRSVEGLTLALIAVAGDPSKPMAVRNKLYDDLKALQPSILEGIDRENISIGNLKENLRQYNEQAIKRIVLAKQQEQLTKTQTEAADLLISAGKIEERLAKLRLEAQKLIGDFGTDEQKKAYNELFKQQNAGILTADEYTEKLIELTERSYTFTDALNDLGANQFKAGFSTSSLGKESAKLRLEYNKLIKAQQAYTEKAEESASMQERIAQLMIEFGIGLDEATEMVNENNKEITEVIGAYDLLSKEIAELGKQLDNELASKDANAKKTAELLKVKLAQMEAIKEERDLIFKKAEAEEKEAEGQKVVISLYDEKITRLRELNNLLDEQILGGTIDESTVNEIKMLNLQLKQLDETRDELLRGEENLPESIFGTEQEWMDVINGLSSAVSQGLGILAEEMAFREKMHERKIEMLNQELGEQVKIMEIEADLKKEGLANSYESEKQQYERLKVEREKNLAEQKRIQKEQQRIQSAEQLVSLVTATANIWKSYSTLPFAGQVLAGLATATMWGAFAQAKSRASQETRMEHGGSKILEGKNHNQGGISIGGGINAEGGEMVSVLSKSATRKYGKKFAELTKLVNRDKMNLDSVIINKEINANFDDKKIDETNNLLRKMNESTIEGGYRVIRKGISTKRISLN